MVLEKAYLMSDEDTKGVQLMQQKLETLTDNTLLDRMSYDYRVHRLLFTVWQDEYRLWQMWVAV